QVAHRHIRTFLPLILRDPPCTTLFPYTTLFRSIFDCLQLEIKSSKTEVYQKTVTDKTDFRYLANARKEPTFHFDSYTQVFHEKQDRKSTRLNSSHVKISYAVFSLKKKSIHHDVH